MNLNHLQSFISVAEAGSFSQAALATRCSQSALSRNVRALEMDLRQTLLLRNGRGVSLTDTGRHLLSLGTNVLNLVARVRDDLNMRPGQLAGRVVVGLPPSLGREVTLPLVEEFKRHLPRARLAVVEGLSTHLGEWIGSGRIDVGLLFDPQPQGRLETSPIVSHDLCLVTFATSSKGDKLPVEPIALKDLAKFPLVMPEPMHVIRHLVDTHAAMHGVKLHVAWEVSSVASIIDLVCAGYGHAILTAPAVLASGQSHRLTARRIVDPSISSTIYSAISANKRSSALTRRILQLLRELVLQRSPSPA